MCPENPNSLASPGSPEQPSAWVLDFLILPDDVLPTFLPRHLSSPHQECLPPPTHPAPPSQQGFLLPLLIKRPAAAALVSSVPLLSS